MPTSGALPWFPTLAEIVDDALEIGAGIDPASASQRHLSSALRSYNRLLVTFDNEGMVMRRSDQMKYDGVANQATFFTPPDTLAVDSMSFRVRGVDRPLTPISMNDWSNIGPKYQRGQPTSYALNFGIPRDVTQDIVDPGSSELAGGYSADSFGSGNSPVEPEGAYGEDEFSRGYFNGDFEGSTAYDPERYGVQVILWPVPAEVFTVVYMRTRMTQEGVTLGENPDVRRSWTNALTLGLAADLALKYNKGEHRTVKGEFDEALKLARTENRSRADLTIGGVGLGLRSRRGRRR